MLCFAEGMRYRVFGLLAGVALLALAASGAWGQDFTPPDPVRFGNVIELGDIRQAEAWLDQGLDPDYSANRIGSGLMIAAWEGNLDMLTLFYTRGADVNKTNQVGEQAILLAAWKGHDRIVDWLLAHGASLNRPQGQWSALHYAAFSGHQALVQRLLDQGADIDARSPNGSTPLMMAIYEGKPAVARLLLARGADTTPRNDWGDGAMEWAMRYNQFEVARQMGSPEAFAEAASRPREHWGEDRRSAAMPPDLEKLVRARAYLAIQGVSLEQIDRNIAALRARYARAEMDRKALPPRSSAVEISAKKSSPSSQKARVINTPYRLPPRAPKKTPARRN
ncbi:MAG: ankyrin repeat domain-containing protein [Zoogloeaceae bacterium]|nr:ankyrin repeat domain-containing protein [Zoogloeaceae bacterium]